MKQTQRVPAHLSDQHERAYLTLVSLADHAGLVTQCSWVNLMDYAIIAKQSEAQNIVNDLTEAHLVRLVPSGKRSPHFQLLGNFTEDLETARGYYASNMGRVAALQNQRTRAYSLTKNGRGGLNNFVYSDIIIESCVEMPRKEESDPRKWRFSMRLPGFGLVKNCIYIDYAREPFINGPTMKVKEGWFDLVEFDEQMLTQIRAAIEVVLGDQIQRASA